MAAYASFMRAVLRTVVGSLVVLVGLSGQGYVGSTGISREGGTLVPAEEYPVFDRVVESKFLTSATRVVVVERLTVTQLHPGVDQPPTREWFDEVGPFAGHLKPEMVLDFIAKNQQPSRLEGRFQLPATVRFVTREGQAEPEVKVSPAPTIGRAWPVEFAPEGPAPTVNRLAFSRVAFNLRGDEALVYVSNERPNGTGAGFLLWLQRRGTDWTLLETEVLWVAHPDTGEAGGRG